MKTLFQSVVCAVLVAISNTPSPAAIVVLDSFTEGDFRLGDGVSSATSSISSSLVDTRKAWMPGASSGEYATLDSGNLVYFEGNGLGPRVFLEIEYSNESGGSFNVFGYDAIALNIVSLRGAGEASVYLENTQNATVSPVRFDSPGRLLVPFSGMGAPLDDVRAIRIRLTPLRFSPQLPRGFEIGISEITLVPEPSALLLALPGALALGRRRRRSR